MHTAIQNSLFNYIIQNIPPSRLTSAASPEPCAIVALVAGAGELSRVGAAGAGGEDVTTVVRAGTQ